MAVNAYYAGGRVAVLTTKLWTKDRFLRLAESSSLDMAVRSLVESGYGLGKTVDNCNDYEEILQAELASSVAFLNEMSCSPRITDCFLVRYDYLNAKVMMKCKYMREEPANLYGCGLISTSKMWEGISVDDYRELPEPMQWALNAIDEQFVNGNRAPSVIDNYLDRAMFKDVASRTKHVSVASVKNYFKISADVANLTCFFRLKRAGIAISADCFAEGGTVKPQVFASLVEIPDGFVNTKFEGKLADIAKAVENGNFNEGVRLAEEYKRQTLVVGKNNFTVEPVICYFMSKLTEIDNIRTVLICVKNGVDKEKVKEKVKELYV